MTRALEILSGDNLPTPANMGATAGAHPGPAA